MFQQVHFEEFVGIMVILAIATACWILPIIQRAEYKIKQKINARLSKHGLRLREWN
jgi:hypothetical protein